MEFLIIPLRERDQPGFFDTAYGQAHRIAKTGLTPDTPIYFNTDLLYKSGQPALDFQAITALLIHELGHQTGNPNHAALDSLGSKVRLPLDSPIKPLTYQDRNLDITITAINYITNSGRADLYINDGHALKSLSKYVIAAAQCPGGPSNIPLGWKIENAHWENVPSREEGAKISLPFEAWINIQCIDMNASPSPVTNIRKVISLTFLFDVTPGSKDDMLRYCGVKN